MDVIPARGDQDTLTLISGLWDAVADSRRQWPSRAIEAGGTAASASPAPAVRMAPAPLRLAAGRYESGPLLGQGGAGQVYQGFDRALRGQVAVKLLQRAEEFEQQVACFEREARLLARVQHPHLIPLYDPALNARAGRRNARRHGSMGGRDLGPDAGLRTVTHDRVPVGEVQVRRGEHVHATDGAIGRVRGLVIDPADHHVTHVLLDEGHLWGHKQVAIPIGSVTGVDDGVRLSLTKDEVRDLPPIDLDGQE
jgi:protein kinase-like protein/PRC-barrel domain protein